MGLGPAVPFLMPFAGPPGKYQKFELVFKGLLETLFVDRMEQNEEIFVRFMNDAAFQKVVTACLASEAYRKLRSKPEEYGR